MCKDQSCSGQACRKRHPRLCKYFGENLRCKFGKECSYIHRENVKKKEMNEVNDELKNIKAEIDVLKNTVNSLTDIRNEGKVIKNMIRNLTDDIENIKVENDKIYQRIKALETEFDDSSSEDSFSQEAGEVEEIIKTKDMLIKCSHCEFCCDKEITMRKHNNTKHSNEETNTESTRCDFMVDQNDMFQIEIVEGEMLYACNICDEGYDSIEEVNRHIKHAHEDLLGHILKKATSEIVDDETNSTEKIIEKASVETEKEYMLKCTLCYESMNGNSEVKEHYVKEHHRDMKRKNSSIQCSYINCMTIEGDKCSQFCFFYKNCLTFKSN